MDLTRLPDDLPVPTDDGAADHLTGTPMPAIALPATDGSTVSLDRLGPGRTIVYAYPLTGGPDGQVPDGWDAIPGARGCTPEACASSTIMIAPWRSATSTRSGSGAMSPSIENTPSVMSS